MAALKVTDGPVGARGDGLTGSGTPTLLLPCGTAMAATFDPDLIRRGGEALGTETRDKGARMLLAPTVNVHRTPLAGRNFECFSEDPHLSARMAVAYIEGVQSQGVSACIKHFVANDQEEERNTIEVVVDERALREIYLPAFEAAVTEAGVWSVMGAYNRLNGPHHCCDHHWLLTDLLKHEWGFEGAVISDWFAVHSTSTVANGADIEMPGPARHLGHHLPAAVDGRRGRRGARHRRGPPGPVRRRADRAPRRPPGTRRSRPRPSGTPHAGPGDRDGGHRPAEERRRGAAAAGSMPPSP